MSLIRISLTMNYRRCIFDQLIAIIRIDRSSFNHWGWSYDKILITIVFIGTYNSIGMKRCFWNRSSFSIFEIGEIYGLGVWQFSTNLTLFSPTFQTLFLGFRTLYSNSVLPSRSSDFAAFQLAFMLNIGFTQSICCDWRSFVLVSFISEIKFGWEEGCDFAFIYFNVQRRQSWRATVVEASSVWCGKGLCRGYG